MKILSYIYLHFNRVIFFKNLLKSFNFRSNSILNYFWSNFGKISNTFDDHGPFISQITSLDSTWLFIQQNNMEILRFLMFYKQGSRFTIFIFLAIQSFNQFQNICFHFFKLTYFCIQSLYKQQNIKIIKFYLIILLWSLQVQNQFAFANCIENTQFLQHTKSKIRGNYVDVASEKKGAVISTARNNLFSFQGTLASPLRDYLYFFNNLSQYVGHIDFNLHQSIIIELLHPYEINLVRFRLWDNDKRIAELQIFIVVVDKITETEIFNGFTQYVSEVRFPDQIVTKIRFYNKNVTSVTIHKIISIIKIQAFYQL
ncbi:unnamed protein product (macronuclear) [Paramecium tetraurelia]|uniref:SUN domain-containing protein n=1 Tax=Paramecium tetraurelia TaxID=5888 RepID=A0E234_PARTE|nr:uncharacterized protein GSPATT00022522001 [Paramecium tetraurelia]CAK89351.1 unnamed protein product [Paramecium tetraurelia]|eukprot:XP_001456748.1 hypothetical protein (macronuclear) [Paramecium tetraurelia strain d4-2]